MDITWSDEAPDSFEGEYERRRVRSPRQAERFAAEVLDAVTRIERFPRSGRMVPEHQNPLLREIPIGRWRLMYRLSADGISIELLVPGTLRLDS